MAYLNLEAEIVAEMNLSGNGRSLYGVLYGRMRHF